MRLGLALGLGASQVTGTPPIITATVAPALAVLEDGDAVQDGFSANIGSTSNYASTAGTISTAVVAVTINAVSALATDTVEAGDAVVVTVTVTDSAANERVWTLSRTAVAIAPAAFTSGQWSVAENELTITALPDNGGSAITDIEYRVDGGAAVSTGETTTGTYTIVAADGVDVEIRAVNAVGAGAWSDTKTITSIWSPVGKTGVVAAWDMETVYQEAALSTVAADTDPVGGVPDLTGNGNILSNTGSARPVRASGGGLFWADLNGADDYFALTLPVGQRTSNMVMMLAVSVGATENSMCMASAGGITSAPFFGIGLNGNGAYISGTSGTPTCHVDDGASLTTRDALRDALVAAGPCLWETRAIDWRTAQWDAVADPVILTLGGAAYLTDMNLYRGIIVDAATISSGDLASARTWAAAGAGVSL